MTENGPRVAVQLVVLNGEKYIKYCLEAVLAQTYPHEKIALVVWDNGSTDGTRKIINDLQPTTNDSRFTSFKYIENKKNLGMWPAQEEVLKHTTAPYVLVLAVDVILDKYFISNAITIFENDKLVGAIEPKIYSYELATSNLQPIRPGHPGGLTTEIIDTCGFRIEKSRRITNIGHGLPDGPEFSQQKEIFAVEGACPMFRREALEDCRVEGKIVDNSYFWYGDDLDLAWRMRLFGWKEIFTPNVIAWHDRQTTKDTGSGITGRVKRAPIRRQIPIQKRRLGWRNTRFTIIKNDYIINILKDLPQILWRELMVFGYTILFEPGVFLEIPAFLKGLPRTLRQRKIILEKARLSAEEIRTWFR